MESTTRGSSIHDSDAEQGGPQQIPKFINHSDGQTVTEAAFQHPNSSNQPTIQIVFNIVCWVTIDPSTHCEPTQDELFNLVTRCFLGYGSGKRKNAQVGQP